MKKCPSCEKTFEDSMRYCQVDGTPLVDNEPAFDPFATMVARPGDLISATADEAPAEEQPPAPAISEPNEVLDLPDEADPLQTVYVSESELKDAMGEADTSEDPGMEVPPVEPELPTFSEPEIATPSFGSVEPPPSPFSSADSSGDAPIPSPFSEPETAVDNDEFEQETVIQREIPSFESISHETTPEPDSRPFADPEPAQTIASSGFETPSAVEEWTPPPVPDANWQNQEIGSNTPFQPPVAGAAGENKTLAIVSLVLGIVSLCCYVSPITGLAAVVTGFMAMKNANNQPDVYGGKGLAIAGMVVGGLFFVVGIVYWVFLLFFGGMAMIMDAAR